MTKLNTRQLLGLALPSAASVVLTNAYRSVDQYWLQWVSTDAQAAVGSLAFVLIAGFAFFEVTAVGAAPLIARATGAENPEERREVLGTAIGLSLVTGAALGLAGYFAAQSIPGLLGLSGGAATQSVVYLQALCLTLLPLAITPLIDQAFIATGDMRTPMILQGLALGLNILFTPFLVFESFAGLPGMGLGVAGAAFGSNASRLISAILGFVWLQRRTGLQMRDIGLGSQSSRILRVGIPAGAGTLFFASVYWVLLVTSVSPLGPHVNAALGIGFSALEGLTWPIFHGISIAVGSVVGRSLGAGKPEHADHCIRLATPLIVTGGVIATLAFFFGARTLTGFFTEDPAVHDAATTYALVLAASQLFIALESLAEGVLIGAGDTKTVLAISLPLNVMRIPLAYALAFPLGWGATGIWWAINLTSIAKALGKMHFMRRGDWKRLVI